MPGSEKKKVARKKTTASGLPVIDGSIAQPPKGELQTSVVLDNGVDILARLGANCFQKSRGTGKSAKDEVRRVMGTYDDEGFLPMYTIVQLSDLTKKSEVNIRTIISDLRSTKYCGPNGVFLTERIKLPNGGMALRYVPPSSYEDASRQGKDVPGLVGNRKDAKHDGRGGKNPSPMPGVIPDGVDPEGPKPRGRPPKKPLDETILHKPWEEVKDDSE